MEGIEGVNHFINGIVWGPVMLCAMLGIGVFYSVRTGFFQVRHFPVWWSETILSVFRNKSNKGKNGMISPFRAMSTALAGAIGTGNIVGVAGAMALGGAGAVFWMWVAAFFGMATSFAEIVLGIRYREVKNGSYVGGPMYYIEKGLGCRWGAVCFAVLCVLVSLGMGNMTQANSVAGALRLSFGIPPVICGAVLSAVTGLIIFGGISRISALTEKLVPVMTALYIIAALIVIFHDISRVPPAFSRIFTEAFDVKASAGGIMGYGMARAVKYGISRGVFSNEAGLGSSPIIHSAADTEDPCRQGMWGIFQVFIDTIVMCTLMSLCILTAAPDLSCADGIALSTAAFENVLGGAGRIFISVSIVLFAFATLISWCYFGEKGLEYLTGGRYIRLYRGIYVCMTYVGCVLGISLVWDISDTLNGLMAIPNIIALILLYRKTDEECKKLRTISPAGTKRRSFRKLF